MQACNDYYYATRDPLGAAGDFITAPEVSQMFGEMVGAVLADAWKRAGTPGEAVSGSWPSRVVASDHARGASLSSARSSELCPTAPRPKPKKFLGEPRGKSALTQLPPRRRNSSIRSCSGAAK